MLCSVVDPFAAPAGCFIGADAPPMMAACVYDDGSGLDEMDMYFNEIEAFVHGQPTTMPSAEFLAPPPDMDLELSVSLMLRRGIKIAAPDLRAPFSYGDDIKAPAPDEDPSWTYDADIDATLRNMETNPAESPSGDSDLWAMQKMTMADRAHLVELMYACFRIRRLPPGTLHRAVSYLDRYLSLKKIEHQELLAITAVFAAAKYESRTIAFNADDVARDVGNGCSRSQVLAMERDLIATLGYNLSGPTADTFVDHFTRHDDEKGKIAQVIRYLAHHLADVTLLDYRCVHSLPSAVAASAILLASRVIVNSDKAEEELLKQMGYKLEDLTNIIDDIYEMHELEGVWPGCALMMANRAFGYYLPPRYC